MYTWPYDWVIKQSFNPQTINIAYWFIEDNASLEVWGGDKHCNLTVKITNYRMNCYNCKEMGPTTVWKLYTEISATEVEGFLCLTDSHDSSFK